MASITEQIKVLRDMTGAGIMDCKKALTESQGDMDKAVEHLRKKGLADMAKRSGRTTNEGRVIVKISSDGKMAVMTGLNCETDFVAKTKDFIDLTSTIAEYVLTNPNIEDYSKDTAIKEMITAVAPKLGENVTLKDVVIYKFEGCGALGYYVHSDNKKSALVEISCDDKIVDKTAELQNLARELALQIVAMSPGWLKREDVPKDIQEKEKEIYRTQAKDSGKPEAAIEKMLEGKLRKFFEQNCLLEQESIRESKTKVADYVEKEAKKLGGKITVTRFTRF